MAHLNHRSDDQATYSTFSNWWKHELRGNKCRNRPKCNERAYATTFKDVIGVRYEHKIADNYKFRREGFGKIIINRVEEKCNLDDPDGHRKYWGDVRHPQPMGNKLNHGGQSLIVWAAFGARGKLNLCFVPNNMKREAYIELLETNFSSVIIGRSIKTTLPSMPHGSWSIFFNHAIYCYWSKHP